MFGSIGGFEMLVLAAIGLLVFGPRRLPEIGRTLGKAMVEFRRAAMELRTSIEREVNLEEVRETTRAIQDAVPRLGDLVPKMSDLVPTLEEEAAGLTKPLVQMRDELTKVLTEGVAPVEPAQPVGKLQPVETEPKGKTDAVGPD